MIDIHSHVLPMVDDGSESWRETEAIFKKMAAFGYSRIVATSHWAVGMPDVADEIIERARGLAARFRLNLSIARECRIHPNLLDHVRSNPQYRIDGGNVVLVELPWGSVPQYTVPVLQELMGNGYQPVLAHPARHPQLWEHNSPLASLLALDVPLQVNLSTIGGYHGREAQTRAFSLLEQGTVSMVASDIHSAADVDEVIEQPLQLLEDLVGEEVFTTLTEHNPQSLLDSKPLIDLSDGSVHYSLDSSVMKRAVSADGMWRRLFGALAFSRT